MKSNNDETLDRVTAEIRSEAVDPVTIEAAANRVWARVSAAAGAAEVQLPAVERIEGCADFQSLIPAYLSGSLSEARSLLLVDHTHECIPCRKAMKQARERRLGTTRKVAQAKRFNLSPVVLRWGIAAAVIIGVGLLAVPLLQRYSPFGGQFEATVQAAEGPVYQVADSSAVALKAGAKLQKGDRVRTA